MELVRREVVPTRPARVFCHLTERARTVLPLLMRQPVGLAEGNTAPPPKG
jgi:DNA-binding HxlR family transcriptional regulator